MALATKCPHCNTIFRVAADQLKLRGGIVRCGACHEVFDGNAALVEPATKPTPVIPEVPVEPAHPPLAPAVADYVHGAPLDFELDFSADNPAPTGEAAAPAVWRTAATTPAAEPAPAPPSPEDVAVATVARVFAAATAHDEAAAAQGADHASEAIADDVAAAPDASATAPDDAAAEPDEVAEPDEPATEPAGAAPQVDEAATESGDASGSGDALTEAPPEPDFIPAFLRAPSAPAQPDGRIEPTLDTPQEHVVAAAIDDAHHFEDLPPEQPPAEETPRDETALHAVAAVNTDVPDDGESVPDDEPAEQATNARRERALKRAQARLEAGEDAGEEAGEEAGESDAAPAADSPEARMRALAGVDETASEDLDHSDLGFVKRHERSQKYGKAIKIAMAAGIPLLLAGLVLQAATTFRDTLAATYPQLKPALAAICQPLGCKVGLPTHLDALSIEQGELASMAENTFSFNTVLRNQSKTVQAWPHIELTLNDNADKPVLRRVFAPREYLPSAADADKGFGPRSEQSIKLYFELKELKASGYHIAIFYP